MSRIRNELPLSAPNIEDYHNRAQYARLTKHERETLLQRHVEAAELHQAVSNHNFAAALRLGAALKQLKGEG